jgi:hypothetical protein
LILLAVGKLTNVALAVAKEPSITNNVRFYWLGANYPGIGLQNVFLPSFPAAPNSSVRFRLRRGRTTYD